MNPNTVTQQLLLLMRQQQQHQQDEIAHRPRMSHQPQNQYSSTLVPQVAFRQRGGSHEYEIEQAITNQQRMEHIINWQTLSGQPLSSLDNQQQQPSVYEMLQFALNNVNSHNQGSNGNPSSTFSNIHNPSNHFKSQESDQRHQQISIDQNPMSIGGADSNYENGSADRRNSTDQVFQQFTEKYQSLIQTIQDEERKREDLERRNLELRKRIFNTNQDQHQGAQTLRSATNSSEDDEVRRVGSGGQSQMSILTPSEQHQQLHHHQHQEMQQEDNHSQMVIKDRMITELSLENRRLKEDLAKTHYSKFQLEQDLSFLKQTLETYLPYFNDLESKNKQLLLDLSSRTKNLKSMGNSSLKIRALEEKFLQKSSDWDKERRKFIDEIKHLKDRLEVLRNMNINLQRLQSLQKKKAAQTDSLVKRCIELEETNQKLVTIIAGQVGGSSDGVIKESDISPRQVLSRDMKQHSPIVEKNSFSEMGQQESPRQMTSRATSKQNLNNTNLINLLGIPLPVSFDQQIIQRKSQLSRQQKNQYQSMLPKSSNSYQPQQYKSLSNIANNTLDAQIKLSNLTHSHIPTYSQQEEEENLLAVEDDFDNQFLNMEAQHMQPLRQSQHEHHLSQQTAAFLNDYISK